MSINDLIRDIPGVFDFGSGVQIPGRFSIQEADRIFLFFWNPDKQNPLDPIKCNVEESAIYFYLHEISKMQIGELKDGSFELSFSVPSISTFSSFVFSKEYKNQLIDVIDAMKRADVIKAHAKFANNYTITFATDKNLKKPPNRITFEVAQLLNAHKKALNRFTQTHKIDEENLISFEEFKTNLQEDGCIRDFDTFKSLIYQRGLSDQARPYVWPYLFGYYLPNLTQQQNLDREKELFEEYKVYEKQANFLKEQKPYFAVVRNTIKNDVKRTDRKIELFISDDSDALKLLDKVLSVLMIFSRDTSYVQGMGDFASMFIMLYIKDVNKNVVTLFDGRQEDFDFAASRIFWNLLSLMKKGDHIRFFKDMNTNQALAAERTFAIATNYHQIMGKWLSHYQLSGLLFLYRHLLLQYKREFQLNVVYRLWDSFYSNSDPTAFPSFFSGALLFHIFPFIVTQGRIDLGEIMTAVESSFLRIDAISVLNMAKIFFDEAKTAGVSSQWLFMPKMAQERRPNMKMFEEARSKH